MRPPREVVWLDARDTSAHEPWEDWTRASQPDPTPCDAFRIAGQLRR